MQRYTGSLFRRLPSDVGGLVSGETLSGQSVCIKPATSAGQDTAVVTLCILLRPDGRGDEIETLIISCAASQDLEIWREMSSLDVQLRWCRAEV